MLSDLPPLKKFNVYNEYGDILLVTSSRYIASWYQTMYNMKESPKLFKIKVLNFSDKKNMLININELLVIEFYSQK